MDAISAGHPRGAELAAGARLTLSPSGFDEMPMDAAALAVLAAAASVAGESECEAS